MGKRPLGDLQARDMVLRTALENAMAPVDKLPRRYRKHLRRTADMRRTVLMYAGLGAYRPVEAHDYVSHIELLLGTRGSGVTAPSKETLRACGLTMEQFVAIATLVYGG